MGYGTLGYQFEVSVYQNFIVHLEIPSSSPFHSPLPYLCAIISIPEAVEIMRKGDTCDCRTLRSLMQPNSKHSISSLKSATASTTEMGKICLDEAGASNNLRLFYFFCQTNMELGENKRFFFSLLDMLWTLWYFLCVLLFNHPYNVHWKLEAKDLMSLGKVW